jgi:hypothetical protein
MVSLEWLAVYHRGEKFDPAASMPAAASTAVRFQKSPRCFSLKAAIPSLIQKADMARRK